MEFNPRLVALVAVILALGAVCWHPQLIRAFPSDGNTASAIQWTLWKNKYQKYYTTPEEESYRLGVFSSNKVKVALLSQQEPLAQFELNHFSDLTEAEFSAKFKGLNPLPTSEDPPTLVDTSTLPRLEDVPASWDWSNYNAVTPVKNQGTCGSCWAFSTTGNLEGLYSIKNNQTLLSFSEQMLVDCSFPYGNYGCDGGLPTQAVQFVIAKGIQLEADYPYVAMNMMCQPKYDAFTWKQVTGQFQVPKNNNDVLLQSAYVEPVSVGVDASNLQFYKGGIVGKNCKFNIDHAVLVTGWGTDQGQDYWLVKNSWGATWGEKGYFRVQRITGTQQAPCAISALASYATVG